MRGQGKRGSYTLGYNSENTLSVMFQMKGSVWKEVIPYCLVNVSLLLISWYFQREQELNVTRNGHQLSGIIVSFFVVIRSNTALGKYHKGMKDLGQMLFHARSLATSVVVATKGDQSREAKQFRNDVAYYTCLLLRVCMVMCSYGSGKGECPWEIKELDNYTKEKLRVHNAITGHTGLFSHHKRGELEEAFRIPYTLANFLRLKLAECKKLESKDELGSEPARWTAQLDGFMQSYHDQMGAQCFGATPFPFEQIGRTIVMLWVFTLPLAMSSDDGSIFSHVFFIFFVTFAFIGLETVATDLEDPFGKDETDIDNYGLAEIVYEDIYSIVDIVDGTDWAMKVYDKMSKQGAGDACSSATERSKLIQDCETG